MGSNESGAPPDLSYAKVVLRCRDFGQSRHFYSAVLGLPVLTTWEEEGGRGAIFALNGRSTGGFVEIYEMDTDHGRYDASFAEPVKGDKIDLQLRTEALDSWVNALEGVWQFEGPEQLPWGQRWIKLRDPDGLQIAIFEGGE